MAAAFAKKKAAILMDSAGYRNILDRIEQHARSGSGGLVLAAPPNVGCSTLLKNFYETSFRSANFPIPVYLSLDPGYGDAVEIARRFAFGFVTQVIAFRRGEIELANTPIGPDEIARLAAIEDVSWIDQALERLNERSSDSVSEMIGRYLSVFAVAESAGMKATLIFDNIHYSVLLENGNDLVQALSQVCRRSALPSLIAGRRRFVSAIDEFDRIDLIPPTRSEAALFASHEGSRNPAVIDDASSDLLAVQFASRPGFLNAILKRLASTNENLSGFPAIQRAYVEELFAGEIGRWFERELASAVPANIVGKFVELIANLIRTSPATQPLSALQGSSRLGDEEFRRAIKSLNNAEIVNVTSNRIESNFSDQALFDYVQSRSRLENLGVPRSVVFSQTLARCISRSSAIMASTYRASTAIGLRELLQKFDGRSIPKALLDPTTFNDRYKGKTDEEIAVELKTDDSIIELPLIVFTAPTESAYSPIGALVSSERSAFGSGFRDKNCSSEDEVYWLAADIDSKLPADSKLAEFWCDRLEAAALASNFSSYQIWIIAPDGFDDNASKVLADRGAFGSGRKEADLLSKLLSTNEISDQNIGSVYEIVIPMGEESELIAAHTLEEIAKKHGIKSHDINQIKTALVEACINASEHSHSPDGRIRQKFVVGDEYLTITITNRGVRLADARRPAEDSQRRGWGLKLIEKLMDEVHISQTDDGTSLSMTKRFATT